MGDHATGRLRPPPAQRPSARHGLAWYEFDPSWLLIKLLKVFGVAKSIKVASIDSQLLSDREAA